MEKKKGKQKNNAGSKEKSKDKAPIEQAKEKEEAFNFGGLPDRDLKKNLGCG